MIYTVDCFTVIKSGDRGKDAKNWEKLLLYDTKIWTKSNFFGSEETHFGQEKIVLSLFFWKNYFTSFLIKNDSA